MEKILVPTDLADHSELALQYAIDFGLKNKAQIVLFNDAIKEEDVEKSTSGLEKAVSDIKSSHSAANDLSIEQKSDKGPVLEGISKMLKESRFDLISMVTHDDHSLDQNIGSISTKIAQKGKAPSILVPENNTYEAIKKILIVNDFTDSRSDVPAFKHLNTVLQSLNAQASLLQATFTAAKVKSSDNPATVLGAIKPEESEKVSFDTYPKLIQEVKEHAQKTGVQMIFIPSGQAIFEKIFVGNLSRKIALATRLPVYIYF
ncbi:universal stress protein [Porifericola rhodea]|uniref:universal stress protein n=1 Tax=Porifericola rhodea TaxID=930972 RepID=UPI002666DBD7|nr:universal stress protein [Porifericola rhodea]WKN30422.1 universal stress protein [Porifericola rhodea]